MTRLLGCLVVICLSTLTLTQNKQSTDAEVGSRLAIVGTVVAQTPLGSSMLLPVRCDKDGNTYVRFFHGTTPLREPIHKFDKDGAHKLIYSITSDPEFVGKGKGGSDFVIGQQGEVYQLASATGGSWIVTYSKDGTLKSKVKLKPDFAADHFEVFDSGDFLVTGVDRETPENLNPHSLFTGIFNESGQLVRKIVLPEDKVYEEAASRGDTDFVDSGRTGGGNLASEEGSVTRGSDGNVYVVRSTTPARVYAIGPGGQVVRSFEVKPRLEGRKPFVIHASNGGLAIQFVGDMADNRSVVQTIGLDGQEHATYNSTALGVAFACYSEPERFTFLSTTNEDKLQLNFAEPR